jgi:hypothetical protein
MSAEEKFGKLIPEYLEMLWWKTSSIQRNIKFRKNFL